MFRFICAFEAFRVSSGCHGRWQRVPRCLIGVPTRRGGEPAHGELIALGTATTPNGSCEVALPSEVTQHRSPIDDLILLMSGTIYTSYPFKAVYLPKSKIEAARLGAYPHLD
jgi:hypothetical protein